MSDKQYYKLVATFDGPKDAVLQVAFSSLGAYVAATGYKGVDVWNMSTQTTVTIDIPDADLNQAYTTCTWLYFTKACRHVLILGRIDGAVLAWDLNVVDGKEVLRSVRPPAPNTPTIGHEGAVISLDVGSADILEGRRGRVAASFMDKSIIVWAMSPNGGFKLLWKSEEITYVPKVVRFSGERKVWVFATTGGTITTLHSEKGTVSLVQNSGLELVTAVAVDPENDCFAVGIGGRGFELWSLGALEKTRRFVDPIDPNVFFPKQVVFTEDGEGVLTGTDHGCGILYDLLVVAATTTGDCNYVAIAGSVAQQPNQVLVWQKIQPSTPNLEDTYDTKKFYILRIPRGMAKLVVVIATLAIAVLSVAFYRPFENTDMPQFGPLVHGLLDGVGLTREKHVSGDDIRQQSPLSSTPRSDPAWQADQVLSFGSSRELVDRVPMRIERENAHPSKDADSSIVDVGKRRVTRQEEVWIIGDE
ncbi:hypothetical protein EUX98_g7500 [Antrodiella citrinella]|uniref:Anaphase-promoting complex subunit 4 WD40 domain-containing protein n=1 Tax=Antrodiella citrinella TaxID=2447956 RepID=A0A4S4MN25_9APHY|nr:hypothetical protein EUX98_g7500 [Antrodiella citrinella]